MKRNHNIYRQNYCLPSLYMTSWCSTLSAISQTLEKMREASFSSFVVISLTTFIPRLAQPPHSSNVLVTFPTAPPGVTYSTSLRFRQALVFCRFPVDKLLPARRQRLLGYKTAILQYNIPIQNLTGFSDGGVAIGSLALYFSATLSRPLSLGHYLSATIPRPLSMSSICRPVSVGQYLSASILRPVPSAAISLTAPLLLSRRLRSFF